MTSSVSTLQTSRPRAPWVISLGAGLLILVLQILASHQPPAQACGGLAPNYPPIIAFELARSDADLKALFGLPGDPCRAEMIGRMDSVNWIDALVFIPMYGVFLAFFFIGMKSRKEDLGSFGFTLVIVAIVTDYIENLCLMQLTPQLNATSVWLVVLPWATGMKWLALAAAGAVAGAIYIGIQPRKWLIVAGPAAAICWIALAVTVAALISPSRFGPVLSASIGATWMVFLITAIIHAVRKPISPPAT